MADPTTRDRIWVYVLNKTQRAGDRVHHTDVVDDLGVTSKTARNALHVMAEYGFVSQRVRGRKTVYEPPRDGI